MREQLINILLTSSVITIILLFLPTFLKEPGDEALTVWGATLIISLLGVIVPILILIWI